MNKCLKLKIPVLKFSTRTKSFDYGNPECCVPYKHF